MRLLSFFFTLLGFLSFVFILFSLKLIHGIVYPNIEEIEDRYANIAVLSGNISRVLIASELYRNKNAEYILLSKENRIIKNYESDSKPIAVYQYYIKVLMNNGVDRDHIILFGDNKNTYDEILSLSKILKKRSSKILLVTDQYHISRVEKIISHFGLSSKIDLYALDNNHDEKFTKRYLQNYVLEYVKLLNFYLSQFGINVIHLN